MGLRVAVIGGRAVQDWRAVWEALTALEAARGALALATPRHGRGAAAYAASWAAQRLAGVDTHDGPSEAFSVALAFPGAPVDAWRAAGVEVLVVPMGLEAITAGQSAWLRAV